MTTPQIQDSISHTAQAGMVHIGYTPFILLALGFAGILLHNLVQLNKINKKMKGDSKILSYIRYERYSILIAVVMVSVCVFISQEIKQLEQVGKWLGLAFISIGYMGQSLLVSFMGKAEGIIGKIDANE